MATFYPNEPLSEKWMKASVIGSLWAVVEIFLGSGYCIFSTLESKWNYLAFRAYMCAHEVSFSQFNFTWANDRDFNRSTHTGSYNPYHVFSVLVQKACSLLIYYGWDIVTLLENMYLYAANQLKFESVAPKYLLIFISNLARVI